MVPDTKIGEVGKKIPDTSGLVTTSVLNTKINENENKIPDHVKHKITPEYNKFDDLIFDTILKQTNSTTNTNVNAV